MIPIFIVTISVVFLVLVMANRRRLALCIMSWRRPALIKGVKYIMGDPVDGRRDMQMALNDNFDLHREMLALVKEEGPVLQTYWRFQHVVIVNEPRLVQQVFEKAPHKIPLNMRLNTILHEAKPAYPDERRKKFHSAMHTSLNSFKRKGHHTFMMNRLRDKLNEHAEKEEPIDPSELFGSFSLDFIYLVLFDLDEDFMGKNLHVFQKLTHHVEYIFDNMEQTPPGRSFASWLDCYLDVGSALSLDKLKKRGKSWKFFQEHCRALLEKLRANHDETKTFVSAFLEYAAKNKWTEDDMALELSIFMVAGHESTSNAMCWLLSEMVRNDGVQEKCREVVRAPKDSEGVPMVPDMQEPLTYLRRVIDESMRLNPVVSRPMLRVSDNDIALELSKGKTVVVPKGTGFLVNFYALHNSESNWDNPKVFDPDRFCNSPNSEEKLCYAPFSWGKRKCPGENIARDEIQYVLEVLTEFNFSFMQNEKKTQDRAELQRSSITMRPAEKLYMNVAKHVPPARNE